MKTLKIENDILETVVDALGKSEMFSELNKKARKQIASRAELAEYSPGEIIVEEKAPSDSFLLIVSGEVAIMHFHKASDQLEELGRMKPYKILGEIGILLDMERTATVQAVETTRMLKFDKTLFNYMYDNIPAFGLAVSRNLARRVQQLSSFVHVPLPIHDLAKSPPAPDVLKLIPMDFIIRHRVIPIETEGKQLRVGFVNDPTPNILSAIRRFLPSMELKLAHVESNKFEEVIRSKAGLDDWYEVAPEKAEPEVVVERSSPQLDQLLKRMVAEGASDLHLTAGHAPYWRIDGDIQAIADTKILGREEVLDLLLPIMNESKQSEFSEKFDTDFVYPIANLARFRVSIFRDDSGVCAVFRYIPSKILTFEQLGLPESLKKFCEHPKGLVLVTGPTGSGKSSTLAAMIDHINKTRAEHIITMEDPIEFAHTSDKCLVNQREIGRHAVSYTRAIRAALREDPDIILVGEMRDLETIQMAIEMANTGHLVFGTLHTATAMSTMARIIDAFPPDQQNQVKNSLSDTLKGVVAQTLCKRIGGGRVAAIEVLVVNVAVSNLIREEKFPQIESYMQTGKAQGNTILNEELAKLVRTKTVDFQEAMSKSDNKADLEKRLESTPQLRLDKKK